MEHESWGVRYPVILNLHFLYGFPILPIGCQAATKQRKAEEKLRLPTWLWLGLKIAGNGILGFSGRYLLLWAYMPYSSLGVSKDKLKGHKRPWYTKDVIYVQKI